MSLLEISHLQKTYSTRFGGVKVEALSDVSFTVEQGEYLAIMGESGAGKTTLLNILAALDRPTGGSVCLNGRDITKISDRELSAYVYRENVILTILGILAGAGIGLALHQYIIHTVEVDMMMFGRTVFPRSYLFSGLLTLVFSLFVNYMMYYRLKKIDMIESLKSVE